jgi:hypothetical protein
MAIQQQGHPLTLPIGGHISTSAKGVNIPLDYRYGRDDKRETQIIKMRHPEWERMHGLWSKYRLAYEGGEDFISTFLYRYSKREDEHEYQQRKRLTYNPAHAKSVINIIRNALMVKMPEVQRDGDPRYLDAMEKDVDKFKSSMATFLGLDVLPLMLAQGKRAVVMDAPPVAGTTQAEDRGQPYMWAVNAEDVLSWAYDNDGRYTSILLRESEEIEDPDTGLVIDARLQYRLMQLVDSSFKLDAQDIQGQPVKLSGPGVLVRVYDDKERLLTPPVILNLTRVPVVEFRIVDAVMTDIADMQVALLNLASTDMSFLFRGNFPIYTEQYDPSKQGIKPKASRRRMESTEGEEVDLQDRIGTDERGNVAQMGVGKGRGYAKELDRPGFIHPPTENLKASMEKQSQIQREIRMMVDLALTSLAVKALEQSGKSKEADRMGEEAGLAYVATALETGEREVAGLWHEFIGVPNQAYEVSYPKGYSVRTAEDRDSEINTLKETKSAVRSPTFQGMIDKRIIEVAGKRIGSQEEITKAQAEVDAMPPMDDNKDRAEMIQKDVAAKVVSREGAAALRGYSEEEALRVMAEDELESERMQANMAAGFGTDVEEAEEGGIAEEGGAAQGGPGAEELGGPGET